MELLSVSDNLQLGPWLVTGLWTDHGMMSLRGLMLITDTQETPGDHWTQAAWPLHKLA